MPQSSASIEYQIAALEKKLKEAKDEKSYYAIKGKINKLKSTLSSRKQFEFLAK